MTGALILVVASLLWGLYYGAACLVWPFRECRKCGGLGRFHARWGGRGWRRCPRCKGSGERLRLGRRVANWIRKLRAS